MGVKMRNLLRFVLILAAVMAAACENYFFADRKVEDKTQEQWLERCQRILNDTHLEQVIFSIKSLCTQLRCLRNDEEVYIGFDYCIRSSNICVYPEPNYNLPFPECCPEKDCTNKRPAISGREYLKRQKRKKMRSHRPHRQ